MSREIIEPFIFSFSSSILRIGSLMKSKRRGNGGRGGGEFETCINLKGVENWDGMI